MQSKLVKMFSLIFLFATMTNIMSVNANSIAEHSFNLQKPSQSIVKHKPVVNPMRVLEDYKKSDDDCTTSNGYSPFARLKRYPFNRAFKILVVSYPADDDLPSPVIHLNHSKMLGDNRPVEHSKFGLKIKNRHLNSIDLKEVKTLTPQQINSLTNILYNVTYKDAPIHAIISSACIPSFRNALIFFDKKYQVYDYMEVCFECNQSYSKSDRIEIGTLCTQKYDILQRFFISAGIKYGTQHH